MTGLVLDENISPALVGRFWDAGIDNWHVRDRGLLQTSDHHLFSIAQNDRRAVVTINAGDFRRLCIAVPNHYGVIAIPSGGTRDQQFNFIMQGLRTACAEAGDLASLSGQFVEVVNMADVKVSAASPSKAKVVSLPIKRRPRP